MRSPLRQSGYGTGQRKLHHFGHRKVAVRHRLKRPARATDRQLHTPITRQTTPHLTLPDISTTDYEVAGRTLTYNVNNASKQRSFKGDEAR
jgi:hypothetical protein